MPDSFLGAMLGCGLGDAIGEMAFSGLDAAGLVAAVEASLQLVYTDDTAMAIGLAESLMAEGDVVPDALARRFAENFAREPWRGYGPGPPRIFRIAAREDRPCEEIARELYGGEGSFGNGAAMRTAPLGLAYRDPDALYAKSCAAAAVTHAHPVGQDGAAVQALAVALAAEAAGDDLDVAAMADRLAGTARTEAIRGKMRTVARLLAENAAPAQVADAVGRSVAVQESMPFAVYAFLRAPRSFQDCLMCAVLNGGDRDTLGAMAGAISGAYLGAEGLPDRWAAKLENRGYIGILAGRLAATFGGRR